MDTYEISTLADLFKVPLDRRQAMFRDMEYAMAMAEFTFTDRAGELFTGLVWTDDGDHSVNVTDKDGETILSLQVTDGGSASG